ncbi:MAG: hypothetical protein M8862_02125, partial [marine benthic group bacterium]|nr:hypothetical protein [Gemmatimonadota bacterium]
RLRLVRAPDSIEEILLPEQVEPDNLGRFPAEVSVAGSRSSPDPCGIMFGKRLGYLRFDDREANPERRSSEGTETGTETERPVTRKCAEGT